ncbi:7244_t:CDS:2 [Dentiscutata heterogama]|uniref:7244_t:CDS:1 n=1 Tax=Dentiscutata heterogama TaxID=1316150 RepID=A0ACA9KMG4_9GLOM|nr:7244_t:CDS:2 [Dentiscutata heterogama]
MPYGEYLKIWKTKEDKVRDWFIDNYDCGFKFNENKFIEKVYRKAFEFTPNDIIVKLERHDESDTVICSHELDVLCSKNRILDGEIKVGLPWLSIFLGIKRGTDKQKFKNIELFSEYSVETWKEAKITFSKSCVKPTNKLIKDVNDALSENTTNEKIQALLKVTKEYGSFYACSLIFGKARFREKEQINRLNESSRSTNTGAQFEIKPNVHGIEAGIGLNISNGTNNKSRSLDSYLHSRNKDIGDRDDYTKWEIIGYDKIHLIFDLLDDDLQKKILDVLGHRILSAGSVPINHDFKKPLPFPLDTALTNVIDASKCHIFVSITNQNVENAFSLHVDYVDKHTPEIVVYRFGRKKNILTRAIRGIKGTKTYSFELNWIIVGQPKDFDFDMTDYPVILRSYNYNDFEMKNNFIQIPIDKIQNFKDIQKLRETCILSTCVLETSSLSKDLYNREKTTIVFSTHYSRTKHAACMFAYNFNDKKNFVNEEILRNLKLHICAVDVDLSYKTFKFGQIPIKLSTGDKNIYYGREFPILKKIFPVNVGSLILVNQILDCSENCEDHGSVNVNTNGIIYKPFGSQRTDKRAIAYLIVPLKNSSEH